MSYKFSKGFTVQGDIKAADDAERNTLIDFGEDQIEFQTSGSTRLKVDNTGIVVTGSLEITQDGDQEMLRFSKSNAETAEMVFEMEGNDKFQMFLNSFENMVFATVNSADDWLLKLAGVTAIYGQGSPKELRLWDSYNDNYNVEINSPLKVSGAAEFNQGVVVTGSIESTTEILAQTGSFMELDIDRLSLSSTQTTVPPLRLTANSLQDNVGALRIDGSEPDIYLNQSGAAAGFTTVTFAHDEQPMVGFGKNSDHNLYFFRETGQDGEPHTYVNTDFVFNRSTGDITMGQDLTVSGALSFEDHIIAELSIPGLDIQNDTNAFTFNCPYNLNFERMDVYLDTNGGGDLDVDMINLDDSNNVIFDLNNITNTGATPTSDTSPANASVDANDRIRFRIANVSGAPQGCRVNVRFRRRL